LNPSSSDAPGLRRRRAAFLLFFGVLLTDLALSPWRMGDRGYNGQDIRAAEQLLPSGTAGTGQTPGGARVWSRHGMLGLTLHLPFIAASRLLFGTAPDREDRVVSIEPVLETALLVLLLFLWARRAGSPRRAAFVALGGAFATILWPYAFVGLETAQSLALFLAAFLALGCRAKVSGARTMGFAAAAILAVSLKSTGVMLIPAVGFLCVLYFRDQAVLDPAGSRRRIVWTGVAAIAVFGANSWTREFFWKPFGGSWENLRHALIHDPFAYLFHATSLLSSPNKGLLFYAPLAFAGLLALPRACRERPRIGVFAALTAGGLVAGFSLLKIWADETWGPRYLHTAIAPLLIVLALTPVSFRGVWRRSLLAAAAAFGAGVSLLGVLFFYGGPYHAAVQAGQGTLEAIQGDTVWNPIRFDLRLLETMARGAGPGAKWTAAHYWWFFKPPGSPPEPVVDLARYAHFQSWIFGSATKPGVVLLLAGFGVAGLAMIALFIAGSGGRRFSVPLVRRGLPLAAFLFLAIEGLAWASGVRRAWRGEFLLQAPQTRITADTATDVRRMLAFAAGDDHPILCVTRRPGSLDFFVWQRLCYPRPLIPAFPEEVAAPGFAAIRDRWQFRYALCLDPVPFVPRFRRSAWITPGIVVGELGS